MEILDRPEWTALAARHRERAEALTAEHRDRRSRGEKHPVWDFLFTYYPFSPARLARWQPGLGLGLLEAPDRAEERFWASIATERGTAAIVDPSALVDQRSEGLVFTLELLRRTRDRRAQLGCFGLHEWAMVYRSTPEELRHHQAPLRLGHAGTDAVVERSRIACSHFDAFRFFTPPAAQRNALQPERATMRQMEQPGCLHAGMDLYKWAMKLSPAVPGDLVLDCFELARDIRALDMAASPYELSHWGLDPVRIETAEGRGAYVAAQRSFAERGQALRNRILGALAPLEVLVGSSRDG